MEKINKQTELQSYFEGFYVKCAGLGIHPDAALQGYTLQRITPEVLTKAALAPIVKAAEAHGFDAGAVFEKHAQAQTAPTGGSFWGNLSNTMAQPFTSGFNQLSEGVSNANPLQAVGGLVNTAVSPVRSIMGGAAQASKYVPGLNQVANVANNATQGVLDTANSAVTGDINGTIGNATNTATRAVQDTANAPTSAIQQGMGKTPAVAGNTRTLAPAAKPGTAMTPVVAEGQTPSFGKPQFSNNYKPFLAPQGPTAEPKPAASTPAPATPINQGNAPAAKPKLNRNQMMQQIEKANAPGTQHIGEASNALTPLQAGVSGAAGMAGEAMGNLGSTINKGVNTAGQGIKAIGSLANKAFNPASAGTLGAQAGQSQGASDAADWASGKANKIVNSDPMVQAGKAGWQGLKGMAGGLTDSFKQQLVR